MHKTLAVYEIAYSNAGLVSGVSSLVVRDPNTAETFKRPDYHFRKFSGGDKETPGLRLLKEPLNDACQRKQQCRKKEGSTLTCNPATLFFPGSDSSRSVNY